MPSESRADAIARIIAETLDLETRGTIRDMIASTRYPVDGPANADEIDADLVFPDRVIRLAAERVMAALED